MKPSYFKTLLVMLMAACAFVQWIGLSRLGEPKSRYEPTWLLKSLSTTIHARFPDSLRAKTYSLERTIGHMTTSGWCNSPALTPRCMLRGDKRIVRVSLSGWAASEFNLGEYTCSLTRCFLGKHTRGGTDYDLLVSALPPRNFFPTQKLQKSTRNAELSMESSINHPNILDSSTYSKHGIDLVVSFRPPVASNVAKWLHTSYVNAELDAFLIHSNDDRWLSHEERDPSMVVMISNCAQNSVKRIDIASGIMKYFPKVHAIGGCLKSSVELPPDMKWCLTLPRRSAMWDAPKECLLHRAMFSYSLENSFEQAYVTEKLWQALKMGAIPIYSTKSVPENRGFLPHPDAALFVEDFTSLEQLSAYMHAVVKNKSLWFKHAMAWRMLSVDELSEKFMSAVNHSLVTLPCRLCDWWSADTMADEDGVDVLAGIKSVSRACAREIFERIRFPQDLPSIDRQFGIEAVFVVHYKPLLHRKVEMIQRVRSVFGSSPTFIEDLDREDLSEADLACVSDRNLQQKFIQRSTKRGEDSLTLKHMAIFWMMLRRNLSNVLVLEDDARFLQADWRSASSQWQMTLKELPADYDLVMLSSFAGYERQGKQIGKHLFLAQASRVSSMYLVSAKGARNMLRTLPVVGPFDFQINYAANHSVPVGMPRALVQDIKVLWSEPAMSDQHDATGAKETVKSDSEYGPPKSPSTSVHWNRSNVFLSLCIALSLIVVVMKPMAVSRLPHL